MRIKRCILAWHLKKSCSGLVQYIGGVRLSTFDTCSSRQCEKKLGTIKQINILEDRHENFLFFCRKSYILPLSTEGDLSSKKRCPADEERSTCEMRCFILVHSVPLCSVSCADSERILWPFAIGIVAESIVPDRKARKVAACGVQTYSIVA